MHIGVYWLGVLSCAVLTHREAIDAVGPAPVFTLPSSTAPEL